MIIPCRLHQLAAASLGATLALAPAFAQTAPAPNAPVYFEFGTVISLGDRILIQTVDQQKNRMVQHAFILTRDSRVDVVHPGDNVEVIYSTAGKGDWTIRRLVALETAIPSPGPPNGDHREIPAVAAVRLAPTAPAVAKTAAPTSAGVPRGQKGGPATATPSSVTMPAAPGAAKGATASSVAMPTASGSAKTLAAGSVALGGTAGGPRTASATDVALGGEEGSLPKVAAVKTVTHEAPAAECNRSSADWPGLPLKLAVLDFRYPTEREESHDIGTTGGGSGTAVADLVYAKLDGLNQFAMMRGDRTRLYRGDFAGAARVGRELGADAVLAGTFQPLDPPPGSDPDFPPPKQYELRAGIVDTCTGQLLLRLTSITCPDGMDPNASANGPSCKHFSVTAKQAADPKDQAHAFAGPIDAMLNPLEHNGPPPGVTGSSGVVTAAADNGTVTLRLASGAGLKAGDQVAIHAWRLTKNPTTYTLHNLHDEEIGRVTIAKIQGATATGTYLGDFPPHPGDTAEPVTQ